MGDFLSWLFPSAPDIEELKLDSTAPIYQKSSRKAFQNQHIKNHLSWLFPKAPEVACDLTKRSHILASQVDKKCEEVEFKEQASTPAAQEKTSLNMGEKLNFNTGSESSRIEEQRDSVTEDNSELPSILVLDNLYESSLEKGMAFLTHVMCN
jgi:hypothetical protein